jgi:hypothetical protein
VGGIRRYDDLLVVCPILIAFQTEYAASVWAIVDCFGGISVTKELNGDNIHRIENIMTLEVGVHSRFDGLNIWFEEMVCYMIKSVEG